MRNWFHAKERDTWINLAHVVSIDRYVDNDGATSLELIICAEHRPAHELTLRLADATALLDHLRGLTEATPEGLVRHDP